MFTRSDERRLDELRTLGVATTSDEAEERRRLEIKYDAFISEGLKVLERMRPTDTVTASSASFQRDRILLLLCTIVFAVASTVNVLHGLFSISNVDLRTIGGSASVENASFLSVPLYSCQCIAGAVGVAALLLHVSSGWNAAKTARARVMLLTAALLLSLYCTYDAIWAPAALTKAVGDALHVGLPCILEIAAGSRLFFDAVKSFRSVAPLSSFA